MDVTNRFCIGLIALMLFLCVLTPLADAKGKLKEGERDIFSLIDLKGCAGAGLTQCELAMNLLAALKMGGNVSCQEGFVHLRALGIAPGQDWSYEHPHRVVTPTEIKDVIMDVHRAYNDGNVRLDGFAVAEEVNRLCSDIKKSPPRSRGAEKRAAPPVSGSLKQRK